ncbi:unnamed protein product [Prorocentrum cordatum]|uniref:Uncharacterized protein n=1 Tax=Prorocentrum cordatum TaxID=2364126 RepID=A0ABN9XFZ7_9DINO|nr:unnamed protein product [Polarella glacialis]
MLQCASHNWWTCAPARNRKQFAKLSPASLCMHEEEEEEGGGGGRERREADQHADSVGTRARRATRSRIERGEIPFGGARGPRGGEQKVDRNQTYHLTAYQPRRRARIPRDEPAACAGAPRT